MVEMIPTWDGKEAMGLKDEGRGHCLLSSDSKEEKKEERNVRCQGKTDHIKIWHSSSSES